MALLVVDKWFKCALCSYIMSNNYIIGIIWSIIMYIENL